MILGKLRSEVFPVTDEMLLEKCAYVVRTQQPVEFEEYSKEGGKWLYIRAVPFGQNQFAVLFGNIDEQKRAEMALRKSEEKYKALFTTIDEGFCIIEVLFDENGMPDNYRFIEANKAFEQQTGLVNTAGKTIKEMVPDHEQVWFDTYGQVAKTGKPARFENKAKALNRYYEVYAFRTEESHVAVLFKDISRRKQEEQRQMYLLELSDILRSIDDPIEIQATVARTLGQYLKAGQVHYDKNAGDDVVIHQDYGNVLPPTAARFRSIDFGDKLTATHRAGIIQVIEDVEKDPLNTEAERQVLLADHIGAYITVPLIKKGDWVGTFAVHNTTPRNWTDQDVELVRETAERTWAAVERAKAEEALRENEERTRTLTNAVPQIIWTNDENGNANFFNQRWFEFSGLSTEESIGKGWEAIVHPDDAPASKEKWQYTLAAGEIFDTEYRLRRHDGVYRWFIGRNIPLKNTEGKITGWFGSATDIKDLKQAQEDVRLSEAKLKTTMDSATDYAIITTDTHGMVELWSCGAEKIFGYTEEEVKGKSADMVFTPEDIAEQLPEKEMAIAREKGSAADERWHMRKDGSKFYMSGIMTLIHDGGLRGYVKVARDMTEQKQAEEQLRILEERNRIALQSAEMGSWDWNVKEDRIIWNEQHHLLLGIEPYKEEKQTANFLQFVHPDDKGPVEIKLKEAVESTGIYKAEFRIIRADNKEVRWMTGFSRAVEWEDSSVSRMVGVMFDITDRKKLEQQKEEFLGIASHELKTPITSIKAYGELVQETFEENGDKESLSLLEKMNAQINRLNGLISDLLDTTKISEGELVLDFESFDLTGLIKQLTEELQQLSQKHELIIECKYTVNIYADKKRIEQVITNLISNAIKYSPEGGDVKIGCEFIDNGVKVSITDKGIGIPKESQQKIFDRFFRVKHTNSNALPGMGLGLYITAGIIRRHGGTIGVSSDLDTGSTFYFVLPYNT